LSGEDSCLRWTGEMPVLPILLNLFTTQKEEELKEIRKKYGIKEKVKDA
jgi:hypothetical protein